MSVICTHDYLRLAYMSHIKASSAYVTKFLSKHASNSFSFLLAGAMNLQHGGSQV